MDKPQEDEFYGIVSGMQLDITGIYELESLDHLRDEILSSLAIHLETFGDLTHVDNVEAEISLDNLILWLNKEYFTGDKFSEDEEIMATGDSLVLIVQNTTGRTTAHTLSERLRLRGVAEGITIVDIPHLDTIATIRNPEIDFDPESNPLPTNPFGIGLVLGNVSISGVDGTYETLPEGFTAVLPLNYPQLRIQRLPRD